MAETKKEENVKVEAQKEEPKKKATPKAATKRKTTTARKTTKRATVAKSSTGAKRPSRAKKSDDKTQTELKLPEDVKSEVVNETVPAVSEEKKETKPKRSGSRSRKATGVKTTSKSGMTARAGRTGSTGRGKKVADSKVTDLDTRRTRKTVAEKAAEAKKVSEEISRRAGRTGARGNRSGGAATLERPTKAETKVETNSASSASTASGSKSSASGSKSTAAGKATGSASSTRRASGTKRVSVSDAVAKEKEALKAADSVPVVDTVSALTESKDPGSNVSVDVKGGKLEISMNFVMDRASFMDNELGQLNFFMEQVVSNMFKMKAVYEWTSEEEKQYIVDNWIESIMEDLRSDEAKAKRLVDHVKKAKKVSEWEAGLEMRKMIAESLKNNENVHFVYEIRGLTDKQKIALEKLVKANKLEIDLNIA